ncbi:MAG: unnamed protein product [uncultured Caballeronia sp.]|nr:MAG: unnamed protein product [uncultured Caballeronia sp.]CAH2782111.1 MAG: unnamed protein product [uncultured Caballeronia sp.]
MARGLGFLIPDNWSAEQTPAIVGPIDALREPICSHCQLALHELRREQPAPPVNPHLADVDDPFRARAARHYHGLAATPPPATSLLFDPTPPFSFSVSDLHRR